MSYVSSTTLQNNEHTSLSPLACGSGGADACHSDERRFTVTQLVDVVKYRGHIHALVQWEPEPVALHHADPSLIDLLKSSIIRNFGQEDFDNCVKQYHELPCGGILSEYSINAVKNVRKRNNQLEVEPLWDNTYIPIENLDASLQSRATTMVRMKLGQLVWNRLTEPERPNSSFEVIDLSHDDKNCNDPLTFSDLSRPSRRRPQASINQDIITGSSAPRR